MRKLNVSDFRLCSHDGFYDCMRCEAGDTARGNKADRGNNADRSNGGNRRTGSKGGGRDGSELREHEGCQHKN